jgi:hypothetical protein
MALLIAAVALLLALLVGEELEARGDSLPANAVRVARPRRKAGGRGSPVPLEIAREADVRLRHAFPGADHPVEVTLQATGPCHFQHYLP